MLGFFDVQRDIHLALRATAGGYAKYDRDWFFLFLLKNLRFYLFHFNNLESIETIILLLATSLPCVNSESEKYSKNPKFSWKCKNSAEIDGTVSNMSFVEKIH